MGLQCRIALVLLPVDAGQRHLHEGQMDRGGLVAFLRHALLTLLLEMDRGVASAALLVVAAPIFEDRTARKQADARSVFVVIENVEHHELVGMPNLVEQLRRHVRGAAPPDGGGRQADDVTLLELRDFLGLGLFFAANVSRLVHAFTCTFPSLGVTLTDFRSIPLGIDAARGRLPSSASMPSRRPSVMSLDSLIFALCRMWLMTTFETLMVVVMGRGP